MSFNVSNLLDFFKKRRNKENLTPTQLIVRKVFKILAISIIIIAFAITGVIGGAIFGYIKSSTELDMALFEDGIDLTSKILDKDENLMASISGAENREWATINEIPKYMQDALVAMEDKRFWNHDGVDFKSLLGLVKREGSAGASTLTMQLIKNISKEDQKTISRKIEEQYRAIELEKKLRADYKQKNPNASSEECKKAAKLVILEKYLNIIYLSNHQYGVKAAAKRFFNKELKDLTIAQCASIAGITQTPSIYDPMTVKGRAKNVEKSKITLYKMKEEKFITDQQYNEAKNQDLEFVDLASKVTTEKINKGSKQSYFVDAVIEQVINDMAGGSKKPEIIKNKRQELYSRGYKIYTTLDQNVQSAIDKVYLDENKYFYPGKGLDFQSGIVILDTSDEANMGFVRGIYGGRGAKMVDAGFNCAIDVARNPASNWKPIGVYAPALDLGKLNGKYISGTATLATVVDDNPLYLGQNKKRAPTNTESSGNPAEGLTTMAKALEMSNNVCATQIYLSLNNKDVDSYIKKMGMTVPKEVSGHYNAALGGGALMESPYRIAAAYATFANKGKYKEPTMYTKLVDKNGKVIIDKTKTIKPVSVFREETALLMLNGMLRVVTGSKGTANSYAFVKNNQGYNFKVAAKTGSSDNYVDRWFTGITPYYCGSVWFGDKDNKPTNTGGMQNPAGKIWTDIMNKIHTNLPKKDMAVTNDKMAEFEVCTYSGKKPTDKCRNFSFDGKPSVIKEWFVKGTEPTEECDVHVECKVDTSQKDEYGRYFISNEFCPANLVQNMILLKPHTMFKPIVAGDIISKDYSMREPDGEQCGYHTRENNGNMPNNIPNFPNMPNNPFPMFTPKETKEVNTPRKTTIKPIENTPIPTKKN